MVDAADGSFHDRLYERPGRYVRSVYIRLSSRSLQEARTFMTARKTGQAAVRISDQASCLMPWAVIMVCSGGHVRKLGMSIECI